MTNLLNSDINTPNKSKTSLSWIGATVLVAALASPDAISGPRNHNSVDWAKVTKVKEITRTVEYSTPTKKCWTEQVRHEIPSRRDRNHNQSYTGTVLGGIIGGAIGNAVGHKKRNKQVGTAVGAILGATIGNDISSRNYSSRNHDGYGYTESPRVVYRDEERCEVHREVSYKEEVIGYRVWYKYHGEEYKTRMDTHPGKRIKVRVNVEPI